MRNQLERKRTHELRPPGARELRPVTDRTKESLE
jgi:16S rRNA G966 N2-methylase RsmD